MYLVFLIKFVFLLFILQFLLFSPHILSSIRLKENLIMLQHAGVKYKVQLDDLRLFLLIR
jgi:hypothetical protein